MTCSKCGERCQGEYCQFCEFDQSIQGDWEDRMGDGYAPVDTKEDDDD